MSDGRFDSHFHTDAIRADLRGRSVRSGAVQLGAQAAQLVLLIGSVMVLARLLTPADFGLLAMVGSLIAFVQTFRDWGFPMAAVHREQLDHQQVSTLFWTSLKLNLLTGIAVAMLAPGVAWFYGEQRLVEITLVMAVGLVALSLGAQHESLLMRQMQFGRMMVVDIGAMALGIAVAITAAFQGAGYWALAYQFVATGLTRSAALWLMCRWRPAWPHRRRGDTADMRSLLSYGAHLTGFRMLTHVGRNLDRVLVGYFGGATVMGLYDSAYRWSLYPLQQVFGPLMGVAVASLSRVRGDPAAYRASCRMGLLPLFAVVLPVLAFMAAEPEPVIGVLLGEKWMAAVPLFQLLCVAAIGTSMIKVTKWLYLAEGETRRQLRWGLISTPIMIIAVVVGVQWGAYGVAVGFTVATWLLTYPSVAFCLRTSPLSMRDFLGIVARPLIASCGAAALLLFLSLAGGVWAASESRVIELLIKLSLFSASYLLLWLTLPGGRKAASDVLRLLDEIRPAPRHGATVQGPAAVEQGPR